jgi:hypothetical protein
VPTDLGDIYAITVETRDEDGELANTGSVEVVVRLPTGASMSSVPMALASTGRYEYDFPTTLAGLHSWEATAAGAVEGTYVDTFVVTSGSDVGIVGLQEAREHLRFSATDDDELLRGFILVASELCEAYTGRAWRRTVVSGEVHDGGGCFLQLRRQPIVEVTAAAENGAAVTQYTLDPRKGRLYRGTATADSQWLPGRQIITVSYVAGPPDGTVPAKVRHGVLECIRHLWESRRGGSGIPRQGPDTEWVPILGYSIPRRVAEMWDLSRRPRVA